MVTKVKHVCASESFSEEPCTKIKFEMDDDVRPMAASLLDADEDEAPESAQEFARRLGYRSSPDDLEMTVRAIAIGSLFAIVNGVVNMFFAFRYAGGLAQYWVILVAYPICKFTETLPRGRRGLYLNPGKFSPKEHVIVMTMAIAGSLAGTLGLSGGMLALSLDFGTRLSAWQVFTWALMAGFFGIFFGTLFYESLVLPNAYPWPFSRANAAFIAAFYKEVDRSESGTHGTTSGGGGGGVGASLRVFFAFFIITFCWFPVPNYLAPTMLTFPVLCWLSPPEWRPVQPFGRGGLADLYSVMSSGVAGAGFPGLGGWASSWAFGPSIIPLETTVWIVVGSMLTSWLFVPAAFFGGLAAWPTSFREFTANGTYYNASEGHFSDTNEPPHLSGVGMTMYAGVALSIVSMFVECMLLAVRSLQDARRGGGSGGGGAPRPRLSSGLEYLGTSGAAGGEAAGGGAAYGAAGDEDTPRAAEVGKRPLSLRTNIVVTAALTLLGVCVVEFGLPAYQGTHGLGMPLWMTALCIAYGLVSSFGCSLVYAVIGQNFSGGCCILMQVLCGVLVPGSARADIIAVMLVNSGISQAMGVLGDLKTAQYLSVSPRSMLQAQLLGALVGVLASATTFLIVLQLNDEGKIILGSGEWPAVGAVSIALNAKVFGEQGPAAVLHGPLLTIVLWCTAFGVVGTLTLAMIPDRHRWKRWLPSPVLLGVAGLYSGINFSSTSMLLVAVVYHVRLRGWHPQWFARFQYISTSGVNAGVGLAGLIVILFTSFSVPSVRLGPVPAGSCNNVHLPAVTEEDVACWNAINGFSGCNTPWPSN